MRAKILIIEDCKMAREALSHALRSDYEVDTANDAESALKQLTQIRYDLLILDLGLPGMDGHKFCAHLKSNESLADVPIIILSGRTEVEEKIVGFSLGARDFVTKPADLRELKARIELQIKLKQKKSENENNKFFRIGPFEGNLINQTVSYWEQGEKREVSASHLEFKLLHFFLTHIEHVVSREQLLNHVWGDARQVSDRSVDAFICKLRRKLGPYSSLLQAVHGAGYRFRAPKEIDTPSEGLLEGRSKKAA